MDLKAQPHDYVKSDKDQRCAICGFSKENIAVHFQEFRVDPSLISEDMRTVYYDNEGNSYSRETPHMFKKSFASTLCVCGLDINDPVHSEGVDLSQPEPLVEFEEYVPVQHFYAGSDGGACLICNRQYMDARHIDSLGDALKVNSRAQQFKETGTVPTYVPLAEITPGYFDGDDHPLDEDVPWTAEPLHPDTERNPRPFFTTGDRVVMGGLGVLLVGNFVIGIMNVIQ